MNLCLNRSLNFIKCVRGAAVQQVAHYNDNPKVYLKKKKERRHHINRMRKSVMLRKMLAEYEPTSHDEMFDEAVRFSEAEFRAQLLHLREEWSKMYSSIDLVAQESRDSEYSRLEAERTAFIEEIEARQAEKRATRPPDRYADDLTQSLEEDYRRSYWSSPETEVERYFNQSKEGQIVTPDTFDSIMDTLLSENNSVFFDSVLASDERLRKAQSHIIEFVLDDSRGAAGSITVSSDGDIERALS